MSDGRPDSAGQLAGESLVAGEREQLIYTLENRFAPHLEAADAAVREAEQRLAEARDQLARLERERGEAPYVSDALPFMRQGVDEEVEGLERKTTGKKLRTSYRFLVDRTVELAAAEVQRFHEDRDAAEREREEGLAAREEAVRLAEQALAAAQAMQERVRGAERAAQRGVAVLVEKLGQA
ncbi:hypothetical protein [Ornithinimicrobium sp. Y1694]|uniref:hypothetical protein n=1 Tax=Ornithinimicrobium sp. Y1694 TaxID=3418590 RepID=UPI003CEB4506